MKKPISKAQLITDGIAQLKTKRQLIKEGVLTLDGNHFKTYRYASYSPYVMQKCLGKSLKVASYNRLEHHTSINLVDPDGTVFCWPIEAVAK